MPGSLFVTNFFDHGNTTVVPIAELRGLKDYEIAIEDAPFHHRVAPNSGRFKSRTVSSGSLAEIIPDALAKPIFGWYFQMIVKRIRPGGQEITAGERS
jgi:hypothetical protein